MMSTPGAGQRNAGAGQQFESGIIDNLVVRCDRGRRGHRSPQRLRMRSPHDAAMAVRHVLAQANIAHDQQIRDFALDGARGLLHDPIFRPGAGGDFIFLFRQSKQNDRRHSQRVRLLALL